MKKKQTKTTGGIMGSVVKGGDMDVDGEDDNDDDVTSSFDTRQLQRAIDFELDDYWDEGEPLGGGNRWPVCITLNIVRIYIYKTSFAVFLISSFVADYTKALLSRRYTPRRGIDASSIASDVFLPRIIEYKTSRHAHPWRRRADH